MTTKEVAGHTELVENLRMNADMLRDGYQKNLTELWHSEVVREAAKHSDEAADAITDLLERLAGMENLLKFIRSGIERKKIKDVSIVPRALPGQTETNLTTLSAMIDTALSQPIEREGK